MPARRSPAHTFEQHIAAEKATHGSRGSKAQAWSPTGRATQKDQAARNRRPCERVAIVAGPSTSEARVAALKAASVGGRFRYRPGGNPADPQLTSGLPRVVEGDLPAFTQPIMRVWKNSVFRRGRQLFCSYSADTGRFANNLKIQVMPGFIGERGGTRTLDPMIKSHRWPSVMGRHHRFINRQKPCDCWLSPTYTSRGQQDRDGTPKEHSSDRPIVVPQPEEHAIVKIYPKPRQRPGSPPQRQGRSCRDRRSHAGIRHPIPRRRGRRLFRPVTRSAETHGRLSLGKIPARSRWLTHRPQPGGISP